MSCGNPHALDCAKALEEVYLYLDGELDAPNCEEVRRHLDECSPCLRLYGIEQEVKILVARCCGNAEAPESLRVRVLTKLSEIRIETSVERRA
jgi:mycothiol system anti-sigma-R factor